MDYFPLREALRPSTWLRKLAYVVAISLRYPRSEGTTNFRRPRESGCHEISRASKSVVPAKAGTQSKPLGSRFRGNDEHRRNGQMAGLDYSRESGDLEPAPGLIRGRPNE